MQKPGDVVDVLKKQRHNLREQKRIFRIGKQFEKLKKKLEAVGFVTTKKDKHSILQATIEYINKMEKDLGIAGIALEIPTSKPSLVSPSQDVHPPHVKSKENVAVNPLYRFDMGNMVSSVPTPAPTPASMDYMCYSHATSCVCLPVPSSTVETVEDSSSTFKNVFFQSSTPALITKLDGTIVEANYLFIKLSQSKSEELKLHSLFSMCSQSDTHIIKGLLGRILNGDVSSAQSNMMWQFTNGIARKVFLSVSVIRDDSMQPTNFQCCVLPLT
jgi:hypothetical protein